MDPLSISASVVAVVTATKEISSIIAKLRKDWTALPGRLHALHNEVQDLTVVLHQVVAAIEDRKLHAFNHDFEANLSTLLERGFDKLDDLKKILERLLPGSVGKRETFSRVMVWRKEQGNVSMLQEDIKRVKASLNVMLGTSNSRDMMGMRLQLENLSLVIDDQHKIQSDMSEQFFQSLLDNQTYAAKHFAISHLQVHERLSRIETLLHDQSVQMFASQVLQIGHLHSALAPPARRRTVRAMSAGSENRIRAKAVSARLRQSRYICQSDCLCSCHSVQRSATPSVVRRVLGQLFIGYAGLPALTDKCDSADCQKSQNVSVSVEYWFPLGFFWSQIIRLQLDYEANVGPSFQLSTLRQVPDSAQCVSFALNGNIDGLKDLFSQGLASPRDVSPTRGYSLLRWALYGQQYEACKFLMASGADPDYRPLAASDDCPSDKACDIILRGCLPREVVEILRIISEGNDFVDRQLFTSIHKIVLGLSLRDLEEELHSEPGAVDVPDRGGRTALQWAAARGDEHAVVTLLSYGADPNNMDAKLNTPLTLAANQNHTVCVRLLLEAGALTDPTLPKGIKFGTPLNCAARNAPDPMLLKTLLDFNADIECTGVDGYTPLLHVARGNSATHAMLLLEYRANINATSKNGQTPLTAAIQYNNHAVLKLLLSRWYEYSECPRLKGPNLLEIVAQYADCETLAILTTSEHLKAKTDDAYILVHGREVIEARADGSEKLISAFDDLLSVLRMNAAQHSIEDMMEAGLVDPFSKLDMSSSDTESDTLEFEDAVEDRVSVFVSEAHHACKREANPTHQP